MFGKRESKERKKKMELINLYKIETNNDSKLLKYHSVYTLNKYFISSIEEYVDVYDVNFEASGFFGKTPIYNSYWRSTKEIIQHDYEPLKLSEAVEVAKEYLLYRLVQIPCLSVEDLRKIRVEIIQYEDKIIHFTVPIPSSKITMSNGVTFEASLPREEVIRLCNESKGDNEMPQLIIEFSDTLTLEQKERMRQLGYNRKYSILRYDR